MKKVLFVCVHNAGRSQMAEAFLNSAGDDSLLATSAGTIPTERVNPVVAEAMLKRSALTSATTRRR